MPPSPLVDLERIDTSERLYDIDHIRTVNPQRRDMEQLDAVVTTFEDEEVMVGLKFVEADEFWTDGHLPDEPIMPGCLIVESAAQLCSFWYGNEHRDDDRFIGFGGLEDVTFRSQVVPGDELLLLSHPIEVRSRRMKYQTQGLVDGKVVFEGIIIGMPFSAGN
jgi:3-hydroxyacyl-[acyl-carrier-protein] dehydratase